MNAVTVLLRACAAILFAIIVATTACGGSSSSPSDPCSLQSNCNCSVVADELDVTRTCVSEQGIAQGLCIVLGTPQDKSDEIFCAVDGKGAMFVGITSRTNTLYGSGWTAGTEPGGSYTNLPPLSSQDQSSCEALMAHWQADGPDAIPRCDGVSH